MSVPHTTSLRTGLLPAGRSEARREGDEAAAQSSSCAALASGARRGVLRAWCDAESGCVGARDRPLTAGLLPLQTLPNSDAGPGPAAAAGLVVASVQVNALSSQLLWPGNSSGSPAARSGSDANRTCTLERSATQ